MENLSLDDERGRIAAQPGAALGTTGQQSQHAVQSLPPQMFTTAAQLLDLTDSKLRVHDTRVNIIMASAMADGIDMAREIDGHSP